MDLIKIFAKEDDENDGTFLVAALTDGMLLWYSIPLGENEHDGIFMDVEDAADAAEFVVAIEGETETFDAAYIGAEDAERELLKEGFEIFEA